MTTAAVPYMPGRAVEQNEPNNGGESYIVPEYQFLAWQWGADARHLQMAQQYLFEDFFVSLARGDNVLPGRHAYSHVNALCSAAKAYLVLGDEKYLKAAVNGLGFVEQQSFVSGGWGPNEASLPRPAIDYNAQHRDMVALVSGPLVLFVVSDDTPKVTRAQLLAARQRANGNVEWHADSAAGPLRLTPFWAIKDETYFTYLSV